MLETYGSDVWFQSDCLMYFVDIFKLLQENPEGWSTCRVARLIYRGDFVSNFRDSRPISSIYSFSFFHSGLCAYLLSYPPVCSFAFPSVWLLFPISCFSTACFFTFWVWSAWFWQVQMVWDRDKNFSRFCAMFWWNCSGC